MQHEKLCLFLEHYVPLNTLRIGHSHCRKYYIFASNIFKFIATCHSFKISFFFFFCISNARYFSKNFFINADTSSIS